MSVKARKALVLAAMSGLAGSVSQAQTNVVAPAAFTSVNGGAGLNTIMRDAANPRTYQLMIAASELTSVIGQNLTAMTWRMSAGQPAFPPAGSGGYNWTDYEIRICTPATTLATMSTTFAANLGSNVVLAHDGPLFLPEQNFPIGGPPNPFGGFIPLQTPFQYNGGDLLIEIRHPGGTFTNAAGFLDGLATTNTAGGYGTLVRAMSGTGNTVLTGAAATAYVSRLQFNATGATTGACCLPDGSCSTVTAAGCTAAGGTYQGDGVLCGSVTCPQPPTGGCCFSVDGACLVRTAAQCTAAGGTYLGNNVTCTSANCTPPGACCFSDGSCAVVMQARCVAAGGVFGGDGSSCATAGCWTPPVLWNTAKIITNPGAGSGGADVSAYPVGAATIGENQNIAALVSVADDFTIPAGETWTINKAIVKGYQTNSGNVSTFTTMVVRIWDRPPNAAGAVSLFGDITTNRINLTETGFSNVYRTSSTTLTDVARPVMNVVADLPAVVLPAGTYWMEWSTGGSVASGPFIPLQTIGGPSFLPTGNALIFRNAPWAPVVDTATNAVQYPGGQPVDLPFILQGTKSSSGPVCYPNCDNSTVTPCLNVGDFSCFLNSFANGNSYANCDGSTTTPVLNVGDFSCFLNAFANGCSSCV